MLGVEWSTQHRYRLQNELRPESHVSVLEVPFPSDKKAFLRIIIIPPDTQAIETKTLFSVCNQPSALWIATCGTRKEVMPECMHDKIRQHMNSTPTTIRGLITRSDGAVPPYFNELGIKCEELYYFNSSMLPESLDDSVALRPAQEFGKRMWEANECSYKHLLNTLHL